MFQTVFLHYPWRKRTLQIVTNTKFKSQHLKEYGGVVMPMLRVTCTSAMAPLTLKGTYRLQNNICYHPDGVFQKCPCRTISCHTVYASQQCGYKENVHEYYTDLPIVQIRTPIKMCSVLWNIKYDIRLQTAFNLIMLKRICNSLHCVAIYILHNFPPFGGN